MRLEAAQFRELAAFAQFGSDLDEETSRKLERGKRLYEVFKQDQYQPLSVDKQVVIYYALINGFLDDVPVDKIKEFESALYKQMELNTDVSKALSDQPELNEVVEEKIKTLLEEYKSGLEYLIK
jgi:F-type H+-transporting ATPase subunit alpha